MITRVPMNISAGTRDARELLVSLLVESLDAMQLILSYKISECHFFKLVQINCAIYWLSLPKTSQHYWVRSTTSSELGFSRPRLIRGGASAHSKL